MKKKVFLLKTINRKQLIYFPIVCSIILSNGSHTLLTLPMLWLLMSKAQGCKRFLKPSKRCHVGTHCKALAEHSNEYPFAKGFNVFSGFLHNFVLANLAVSSRVNLTIYSNFSGRFFEFHNEVGFGTIL